jgi:hypothetical protein
MIHCTYYSEYLGDIHTYKKNDGRDHLTRYNDDKSYHGLEMKKHYLVSTHFAKHVKSSILDFFHTLTKSGEKHSVTFHGSFARSLYLSEERDPLDHLSTTITDHLKTLSPDATMLNSSTPKVVEIDLIIQTDRTDTDRTVTDRTVTENCGKFVKQSACWNVYKQFLKNLYGESTKKKERESWELHVEYLMGETRQSFIQLLPYGHHPDKRLTLKAFVETMVSNFDMFGVFHFEIRVPGLTIRFDVQIVFDGYFDKVMSDVISPRDMVYNSIMYQIECANPDEKDFEKKALVHKMLLPPNVNESMLYHCINEYINPDIPREFNHFLLPWLISPAVHFKVDGTIVQRTFQPGEQIKYGYRYVMRILKDVLACTHPGVSLYQFVTDPTYSTQYPSTLERYFREFFPRAILVSQRDSDGSERTTTFTLQETFVHNLHEYLKQIFDVLQNENEGNHSGIVKSPKSVDFLKSPFGKSLLDVIDPFVVCFKKMLIDPTYKELFDRLRRKRDLHH